MIFEKFPKLYRLNGPVIVTEKIDGTNACVIIDEMGNIAAQSRTRLITPENDNFGFARWVYENKDMLISVLGEGRHFGEWWGKGIQRGYNKSEKWFALFNTNRWIDEDFIGTNICVVPTLFTGTFTQVIDLIPDIMQALKEHGSQASPGYMNPEGICIYDTASGVGYKKTFDHDDTGKGGNRDQDENVI